MALVINTNVASLNSQRQLMNSGSALDQATERLSSGKRINSAKDDAAGLAIANRMTSQIRGLDQAVRNANDGVSLIQTAEGALQEVTNILQRMRELAIQSANGIYSDEDRGTLDAEVQQLKTEIQRIADTTSFNGQNLLDGSLGDVFLQIGSEANQTVGINIAEVSSEKLGVSDAAGVSSLAQTAAVTLNGLGSGDLIINGAAIDAAVSGDDTASFANKTASAIAIAAAVNKSTDDSNVVATVGETTVGGASMTAAALTGTITINGVTTASISTSTDAAASRAAVVTGINAIAGQTGVMAYDTGSDTGGVTLVAEDGRNITLNATTLTAAATGVDTVTGLPAAALTHTGTVSLRSNNAGDITIEQGATGSTRDAGFELGTFSGVQAQVSSSMSDTPAAMVAGDVKINGVTIGASLAQYDTASSANGNASAISKAAAINLVKEQTGVEAVVRENTLINSTVQLTTALAVSGSINGVAITGFTSTAGDAAANRQAMVNAVNAISEQTGVTAIDTGVDGTANGGGVSLVAADGRNIVINLTNGANGGLASGATTAIGEYSLVSDKEIVVERGSTANIANSGLKVGTYGNAEDGQAIANIDISTAEGAQEAISGLNNAIDSINATRADLGAVNNRLDFAVSNLSNVSEKTAAARSRIIDADFAAETSNLSRSQVLQQAATAMLAQSNARPQQVLALLQ